MFSSNGSSTFVYQVTSFTFVNMGTLPHQECALLVSRGVAGAHLEGSVMVFSESHRRTALPLSRGIAGAHRKLRIARLQVEG